MKVRNTLVSPKSWGSFGWLVGESLGGCGTYSMTAMLLALL